MANDDNSSPSQSKPHRGEEAKGGWVRSRLPSINKVPTKFALSTASLVLVYGRRAEDGTENGDDVSSIKGAPPGYGKVKGPVAAH